MAFIRQLQSSLSPHRNSEESVMITPKVESIPNDALPIKYRASNGKSGTYYLWKRVNRVHGEKIEQWYWWALGNGGIEDCAPDATAAARDWITNSTRAFDKDKIRE